MWVRSYGVNGITSLTHHGIDGLRWCQGETAVMEWDIRGSQYCVYMGGFPVHGCNQSRFRFQVASLHGLVGRLACFNSLYGGELQWLHLRTCMHIRTSTANHFHYNFVYLLYYYVHVSGQWLPSWVQSKRKASSLAQTLYPNTSNKLICDRMVITAYYTYQPATLVVVC